MSKKQLSILIASLFAAAPALAQSDDPFRVQGTGTRAASTPTPTARGTPRSSRSTRTSATAVLSNVGVRAATARRGSTPTARTSAATTVHEHPQRHVRRVQGAGLHERIPHNFLRRRPHAVHGQRQSANPLATLPEADAGTWNRRRPGLRAQDTGGYFEWQRNSPWYFRVDGNQVKTAAPRSARGPTARARATATSTPPFRWNTRPTTWRRGRLHDARR